MNESDAKAFIAAEVNRLLWTRIAWLAALVGIANVIAAIALWWQVVNAAKTIAQNRADEAVKQVADDSLARFRTITNMAEKSVAKLNESYSDLFVKVGKTEAQIEGLQSQRGRIENALSVVAREAERLRGRIDAFKEADVGHALSVITVLRDLPKEAQQLTTTLVAIPQSLDQLREKVELAETASRSVREVISIRNEEVVVRALSIEGQGKIQMGTNSEGPFISLQRIGEPPNAERVRLCMMGSIGALTFRDGNGKNTVTTLSAGDIGGRLEVRDVDGQPWLEAYEKSKLGPGMVYINGLSAPVVQRLGAWQTDVLKKQGILP